MLDLPFKLFPPALMAGTILYAAVTALWLQPLVEHRMAEKFLIPQCQVGLQTDEAATPLPENPKRRELELMITYYKRLGLDQLPFVTEAIEMLKAETEAMRPKRLRISSGKRNSICACSVEKAFSKAFTPMLLYVASLRTHEPASVTRLSQSALRIARSGDCGALPWAKN